MSKKTFCVWPFIQVVRRTNGGIGPCCEILNIGSNPRPSINDVWQSQELNRIRQTMLHSDDMADECKECYRKEALSSTGIRVHGLERYKWREDLTDQEQLEARGWPNQHFPQRIELHVSNLCNLKCLTCRPEDSSNFLAENKQYNISSHKQSDYEMSESELDEIFDLIYKHGIDTLDLRGGESMMVPTIKHRLMNIKNQNMSLRIQTNGTLLDQDWKTIIGSFKNVEVTVSVDAVGQHNHYIRYPSHWETIEKNIQWLQSQPNVILSISCTLSNLNFGLLPEFLQWANSNNLSTRISPVGFPHYYQPQNLPEPLWQEFCSALEPYQDQIGVTELINNKPLKDPVLWEQFCKEISFRDSVRNNSIFDHLPQLRQYWVGTYKDFAV